jgi:hypothetical protein
MAVEHSNLKGCNPRGPALNSANTLRLRLHGGPLLRSRQGLATLQAVGLVPLNACPQGKQDAPLGGVHRAGRQAACHSAPKRQLRHHCAYTPAQAGAPCKGSRKSAGSPFLRTERRGPPPRRAVKRPARRAQPTPACAIRVWSPAPPPQSNAKPTLTGCY